MQGRHLDEPLDVTSDISENSPCLEPCASASRTAAPVVKVCVPAGGFATKSPCCDCSKAPCFLLPTMARRLYLNARLLGIIRSRV